MHAVGSSGGASHEHSRALVYATKQNQYVEAERALGARHRRIVLVHILPNIVAPLLVLMAMDIPSAVTTECEALRDVFDPRLAGSGCGKSTLSAALMGLLPPNGRVVRGRIGFGERDLLQASRRRSSATA